MDNNDKARKVIEASNKLEDEYRNEGKPEIADRIRSGFDELPVGSLARLYDILCPPAPRSGTLDKVLGPTENIGSIQPD